MSAGISVNAPRCSVALTFHIDDRTLKCHYCQFTSTPPETCPACRGTRVEYFGTGTQKVERESGVSSPKRAWPAWTAMPPVDGHAMQEILTRLARGEIDILIGTQMITRGTISADPLVGVVSPT